MKLLLPFFLLVLSLHAVTFDEAKKQYEAREYERAYKSFRQLFLQDVASGEINFYLGLSAYTTKRYDAAIAAFERVLIANPAHIRTRLELARTYFALGMYDMAEEEFNRVLIQPIPAEVREKINRYIARIDESRKRSYLTGSLAIGVLSDDNVNNGNEYTVALLGNEPVNPKKSDTAHTESVGANHIYDFGNKQGYYWLTNATLYNRGFSEESDFDILYGALQTGIGYSTPRGRWQLPISFDHLTYGGTDYLASYGIAFSYEYFLTKILQAKAQLRHQDKSHLQSSDEERDSRLNELLLGAKYYFSFAEAMAGLDVTATQERKKSGERADVDNDALLLKALYYQRFGGVLTASLYVSHRTLRYSDKTYEPGKERDEARLDTALSLGLTGVYALGSGYSVSLGAAWLDNRSSHGIFEYTKQTVNLSLEKVF